MALYSKAIVALISAISVNLPTYQAITLSSYTYKHIFKKENKQFFLNNGESRIPLKGKTVTIMNEIHSTGCYEFFVT